MLGERWWRAMRWILVRVAVLTPAAYIWLLVFRDAPLWLRLGGFAGASFLVGALIQWKWGKRPMTSVAEDDDDAG